MRRQTIQHRGNSLVQIGKRARAEEPKLRRMHSRRVEEQFMIQPGQGELLKLPLIHLDQRLSNLIEKAPEIREALKSPRELGQPHPFRAFSQGQDSSSRLHDVLCRREPFERLVKRQVQRMPRLRS